MSHKIDLSWNSSRLEGNTYSLLETERLLELDEPDPFRLRYRALVAELVSAVVRTGMDKKAATALARRRAAEQVPPTSQARFVEVVETEIMSLHEGNIARYRLRPAEYQAWRQGWR